MRMPSPHIVAVGRCTLELGEMGRSPAEATMDLLMGAVAIALLTGDGCPNAATFAELARRAYEDYVRLLASGPTSEKV